MKSFLIGLLGLFVAGTALAVDPGYSSKYLGTKAEYIKITSKTCTSRLVLGAVQPQFKADLKEASYHAKGKPVIKGCYLLYEGVYQFLFEDGNALAFPEGMFEPILRDEGKKQAI